MMTRTRCRTVVFSRPFRLAAFEAPLPPGSYVVETEEELIQELSFPAYRRTAAWLRISAPPASRDLDRVVNVDPAELDAALAEEGPLVEARAPSERTT